MELFSGIVTSHHPLDPPSSHPAPSRPAPPPLTPVEEEWIGFKCALLGTGSRVIWREKKRGFAS